MARKLPYHNAHFRIETCRQLAKDLRNSGQYLSVSIGSPVVSNGIRYGQVFIEPKAILNTQPVSLQA